MVNMGTRLDAGEMTWVWPDRLRVTALEKIQSPKWLLQYNLTNCWDRDNIPT